MDVTEHRIDNGYLWTHEHDSLTDRRMRETAQTIIGQKAETRMPECCVCGKPCKVWVREIRFQFKNIERLAISSADYSGPVPGFCAVCGVKSGPEALAKAVYMDKDATKFTNPTEWVVEFTDSSKVGGPILSIVPTGLKIEAADDYKSTRPQQ